MCTMLCLTRRNASYETVRCSLEEENDLVRIQVMASGSEEEKGIGREGSNDAGLWEGNSH